jgi:ectoine hydroxylase-related dioxygenase (phytanoyl-CoA dioxygenase family)
MHRSALDHQSEFLKSGRLWLRGALAEKDLRAFDSAVPKDDQPGKRLGIHATFSRSNPLTKLINEVFPNQRPVRAVTFNKSDAANWGVPWHQDRIIALKARHDLPTFSNWSQKAGVWHCEPPIDFLSRMLFVRVHLDPSDAMSGPMEIAVGSHNRGFVLSSMATETALAYPVETCLAERGDVLVLHMLTLHRSLPARNATTRRALRVDFCAESLPPPLEWAD